MPETTLTTGDIAIDVLVDVCVAMEVIDEHITTWAMEVIQHPEQGPALRRLVQQLLAVVEGSSVASGPVHTMEPQPMSDGGS